MIHVSRQPQGGYPTVNAWSAGLFFCVEAHCSPAGRDMPPPPPSLVGMGHTRDVPQLYTDTGASNIQVLIGLCTG